jgi:hypothetical protein
MTPNLQGYDVTCTLIGGINVIRLSLPWVVDVVQAVDQLSGVKAGVTVGTVWGYIYTAHNNLDALTGQSLYSSSIVAARGSAFALRERLAEILAQPMSEAITDIQAWMLDNSRKEFRTILLAELATLPTYFVSAKPPYNTEILLNNGDSLMPSDLGLKVPEAMFDVREAAKCLAFDVGTASAFHAFRALESVVRRYHVAVTDGAAEPKQRNLGVYIRSLSAAGADTKVIAALQQLKDLHRNPIAHPEAAIPLEEAITICGLVRSAIAAMLSTIPATPITTTTV